MSRADGAVTGRTKRLKITLLVIAGILVLLIGAFLVYVSIYYHADEKSINAMTSEDAVTVTDQGKYLVFAPEQAQTGLIFYPGGKVDCKAYAPLMHLLAERNILCVVLKMPFNLAVFNPDAADGIQEDYPEIQHWYLGGHSLGGSMAALYAEKHTDAFDGLILLAAYSTADLSQSGLQVLSIYGGNDNVLNRQKYEENRHNLPDTLQELVIPGGCHAYFGSYGKQSGDGEPAITPEEQWQQTVDYIIQKTGVGGKPGSGFCPL